MLTPTGFYWQVGHDHYGKASGSILGSIPRMMGLMLRTVFDPHIPKLDFKSMPSKQDAMAVLKTLLESGKLTPIIDKTFPLSGVPAGMRYMQEGRAVGRIIIAPWETKQ